MTQPRRYLAAPHCPTCAVPAYPVYVATHDGPTLRRFVCSACNWQSPVVSEPGLVIADVRRAG